MLFVKSLIIAFIIMICILIIVNLIEKKILNENARLQEIIILKTRREEILFKALNLIRFDIKTVLNNATKKDEKVQILTEICNFIDTLEQVSKENK